MFEDSALNIYCLDCQKNCKITKESWELSKHCRRCRSMNTKHMGYCYGNILKGWRGLMDDSKPDGGMPWGTVPGDDTDPDNPANKEQ